MDQEGLQFTAIEVLYDSNDTLAVRMACVSATAEVRSFSPSVRSRYYGCRRSAEMKWLRPGSSIGSLDTTPESICKYIFRFSSIFLILTARRDFSW